MRLEPLGDNAVTIALEGAEDEVRAALDAAAIARAIRGAKLRCVIDVMPGFGSVSVFYDVDEAPVRSGSAFAGICETLRACIAPRTSQEAVEDSDARPVEIPVRYGGEHGPDLQRLALEKGLTERELIDLHGVADYVVLAVGFMPGFAYLGGLPERLHAPRLATPRTRVPRGSVAIGGPYTGVYPTDSPGGWNVIGRTPTILFDATAGEPALLRVGQRVRFRPIT